jgi:DNA-3-methyladenine glycosylase II
MTLEQIQQAEEALIKADPKLGLIISQQTLKPIVDRSDYFTSLCRSIVGQQVSVAAARAIYSRLEDMTSMVPVTVAALTPEDAKVVGLSKQKMTYIKDLAQHFVVNPNIYNHLESLDDEQIIAELTKVKGIGPWTAQMFLMSTLGRLNVFAPDDVGLQKAIMKIYGYDVLPAKQDLMKLAEKWSPYKTIASLHLWHSLDNSPE